MKLLGELNVLLLENLTPYIVTKCTNNVEPRCTMPGWSYRVTLFRESGSEWSILELGKIFMEGNIHGNIKECKGQAKNVVSCVREFLDTAQGEIGRDVAVFEKEALVLEDLAGGPPTCLVPIHSEGAVGPACAGVEGYEPLDEESMKKSAKKFLKEQRPQVRVEPGVKEPMPEEIATHEAKRSPCQLWCEICIRNPKAKMIT